MVETDPRGIVAGSPSPSIPSLHNNFTVFAAQELEHVKLEPRQSILEEIFTPFRVRHGPECHA